MSSSEDDAFASADEDVGETPGKAKSDTKEISAKIMEAISDSSTKEEPNKEAPKSKGVRKLERPVRPADGKPKMASKLGMKVDQSSKTVKSAVEKAPPPQRTQCWEYSSWEEYQKEMQSKTSSSKSSEKDDWESDDWEKPTESDTENLASKNLYGVFPKSEISSSKQADLSVQGSNTGAKTEEVSRVLDKLSMGDSNKPQQWGWKPWGGITSLLSTATEGVVNLTSHVSQGISTVIESGIGVPDPAEMAKHDREMAQQRKAQEKETKSEKSKKPEDSPEAMKNSLSLGDFMSGVTQISNKVISGGLDTLEGIGKKTMNIIQENDPGLLNKRKLLGLENEKPVLSQILREAKEKTEEAEKNMKHMKKDMYKKQLHFETLFDDYCGLVHLEALEILSKQSALKLETLMTPLSGKALKELQETMAEVKELCELPELDDESDGNHSVEELESKFETALEDLDIKMDFKEVSDIWKRDLEFLEEDTPKSAREIYDKSLHSLAQTTAISVNKFHKLAELLLIQDHHSTVNEADSLVQLTTVLSWHLGGIANRFGNSLNELPKSDEEDINALITSICLEGTNSTTYIQNAFHLFIPILQMGAA